MTVDLMRQLKEQGAVRISELQLIFGLSNSAVYAYFGSAELSGTRLIQLFKMAESDRAREIILDHLIPGSGYHAMRMPEVADIDGDGDVDIYDAIEGAVRTIDQASTTLKAMLEARDRQTGQAAYIDNARRAIADTLEQAHVTLAILDWLQAQRDKRRKLGRRGVRLA